MRRLLAGVPLAGLLTLGVAPEAPAQVSLGGMNLEGEIEAGPIFYLEEPSKSQKAKFEEYRDMTQGLWLNNLSLRLFTPDEAYETTLSGYKWGYEDQNFRLTAGRLGTWQFYFEWDQLPHVYSTNSRMLAVETRRGVFELPTPRPALSAYNTAREIDEISMRWDTAKMGASFSISPYSELTAEYTRTYKHGDKPFSLAFGSPGNQFMEVLEPINQQIHDFRLKYSLARENFQLQIGYGLSVFRNENNRVLADNPCFGPAASPCGGTDTVPSGQISLAPDNQAHSINIAAGVNLPMRTRLTANINYSLRLQNDEFLPHTINQTVLNAPANAADLRLPQDSLNGNVQTVLVNLMATSRPLPKLTLFGKYRYYDMFDLSDVIHFNKVAVNDRSVDPARRAGRWDYSKQNAELGARYQLLPWATVGTSVGWERWDRNFHREVEDSDEFFAKATLDLTPADWVLIRGTYRPAFRRINAYNTGAHAEHTVDEDATAAAAGQAVDLRKYDEGERNEQRFDLQIQFTPFEGFSVTPTGSYRYDDYIASKLGLQETESYSLGIDLTWSPIERLQFSAGYVHEHSNQKMRSRSRVVNGGLTFDFKDFEWLSRILDTYDTFYTGLKWNILPRVLDFSTGVNFATSFGRVNANNPVPPASSPTASQNVTARAADYPSTEDLFVRLDAALTYHFWKQWTATLGYAYEHFSVNDWRTNHLMPFTPGVTSIWLGNDVQDYTAHIVGVRLGYRF